MNRLVLCLVFLMSFSFNAIAYTGAASCTGYKVLPMQCDPRTAEEVARNQVSACLETASEECSDDDGDNRFTVTSISDDGGQADGIVDGGAYVPSSILATHCLGYASASWSCVNSTMMAPINAPAPLPAPAYPIYTYPTPAPIPAPSSPMYSYPVPPPAPAPSYYMYPMSP